MSKSVAFLLVIVFLAASCVLIFPIKADSRTIVVPDDYPTITAAIGNATDGDTILVRKGTYEGPKDQTLVINKTLSLLGEKASSTIIKLHPLWSEAFFMGQSIGWNYAPPMQILANDVMISGFTLASDGGQISAYGAKIQIIGNIITTKLRLSGWNLTFAQNTLSKLLECAGDYCSVAENNVVGGYIGCYGSHCTIFANNVTGAPVNYGISVGGEATSNMVYANTVKDGGGIGLGSTGNTVAKNVIINCSAGVGLLWGGSNIVCANTIMENNGTGLLNVGDAHDNTFYANYVANNLCGARIESNGVTTLYCNNFVDNTQQVNTNSQSAGYFDNQSMGNYWSDYTGNDTNGDGIGNSPYIIDAYRQDNYPLMAPFDVPSVTIQIPEWANISSPTPLPTPSFPPISNPPPQIKAASILILSPQNKTYTTTDVPLNFTLSESVEWIRYSLDAQDNVTIYGNTTLTELSNGLHNVTVYAKDIAGNIGVSETINFSVKVPFPTEIVAVASGASVAVIGACFLVYFKKRKHGVPHL